MITVNTGGATVTLTIPWYPDDAGPAPVPARPVPRPPTLPPAAEPACTCPPAWGGLCPPPACPAHGQAQTVRVVC